MRHKLELPGTSRSEHETSVYFLALRSPGGVRYALRERRASHHGHFARTNHRRSLISRGGSTRCLTTCRLATFDGCPFSLACRGTLLHSDASHRQKSNIRTKPQNYPSPELPAGSAVRYGCSPPEVGMQLPVVGRNPCVVSTTVTSGMLHAVVIFGIVGKVCPNPIGQLTKMTHFAQLPTRRRYYLLDRHN